MTQTYTGLFIGGPRAGESLTHDAPQYRALVDSGRDFSRPYADIRAAMRLETEVITYVHNSAYVSSVPGIGFRIGLWIPSGVTLEAAVNEMARGYSEAAKGDEL